MVAVINLFILYNTQISYTSEAYSILRGGDLKTKVETIASLASSIANGNEKDRVVLEQQIDEFNSELNALRNGGEIRGQSVTPIPSELLSEYDEVSKNWSAYNTAASQIQSTGIYNRDVVDAVNYILGKNTEMLLTTDSLIRDLEVLDRNYNKHKEIAHDLQNAAKTIGQDALLVSTGQENGTRGSLHNARISFDVGMRKLLQEPLTGLDLTGMDVKDETLQPIPRENSDSLDHLDLLWESVELRVKTLESKSLYSEGFRDSYSQLNVHRNALLGSIDNMIDMWNEKTLEHRNQGQLITQSVIGVDIAIFVIVLFIIRKSLLPLETITKAISRVKEGIYGEKIEYSADDEIGQLASSFNTMSQTIKIKEEEAKRTDIAKDEFLAMITHELKTPLVPIQGYADILLSGYLGNLTDKQRERISIIKSSAASLLQLISDLLDVQKLELGQLRMKKEQAKIHDSVSKSIQILQPDIEESGVKVVNEVDPNLIVTHDPDRITQVLTNLIKNSIKATKPHEGLIKVYSSEEQDNVKLVVQDNGIGIPLERQDRLFTKFYQVDASLTREKGGSGLGLSICKGIVEAHDGKISLQSSPNEGTTITIILPKHG